MHRLLVAALLLTTGCGACREEAKPAPAKRVDQGRSGRVTARATMSNEARVRSVRQSWVEAPPRMPLTVVAWTAAEESDSSAAWSAAAEAYAAERETCEGECTELDYAVVLARKNALTAAGIEAPSLMDESLDPVALPAESQAFLESLDRYIEIAPPDDPDVVGMQFLAARMQAAYRQPDAIARMEAILMTWPQHETALYTANILLNELSRRELTEKMQFWVDRLLGNPAWLADKPDLAVLLGELRQMLASR
jgi:hypothetical protein